MSLSNKTRTGVLVKAKKKGSGTVTAKAGTKKYTCKVTIKDKKGTPKLSAKSKTIYIGESFKLTSNMDIKRWYSDDPDVTTVSHKTKRSVTVAGKVAYDTYI